MVRGSDLILRVLPRRRHVSRLTVDSMGARAFVVSDAKRAGARVLRVRQATGVRSVEAQIAQDLGAG